MEKKGFEPTKRKGDHNYLVYIKLDGTQSPIQTHTSHGADEDLGNDLLGKMSRQCRFERMSEFLEFADCPMNQEEYEGYLNNRGIKY